MQSLVPGFFIKQWCLMILIISISCSGRINTFLLFILSINFIHKLLFTHCVYSFNEDHCKQNIPECFQNGNI